MQIKEIKPIHFLYFKTETRVSELSGFVSRIARALHLEAAKLGLDVTGPVYWNYFGFAGDVSQPFTLEISIPIASPPENYQGEFLIKKSESFKCLSTYHEGSWYDLPVTYGKLMQYMQHHQLNPTMVNREIYINCDFETPAGNFTEVQIGIQ
ncbi:MAG TPA: GyrI-like domain-containing protein [Cyclobacteriaceae bacterium]